MHELAITREIIATIKRAAEEQGLTSVTGVTVEVGGLTTYKEDPIDHYFGLLKEEHGLDACTLTVKEKPGRIVCLECGKESVVEDAIMLFCPECESVNVDVIQGKDVVVNSLTGETKTREKNQQSKNAE